MNIDIERLKHDREYWDSVAPEGATHYREDSTFVRWYRIAGNTRFYFSTTPGRGWTESESKGGVFIPRPAKQWSGDDLPPVGVECEAWFAANEWVKGLIVAHDEVDGVKVAVFRYGEKYVGFTSCCLRPLKSEKDRVVEWALSQDCEPQEGMMSRADFCAKLYDLGALKMPEGE